MKTSSPPLFIKLNIQNNAQYTTSAATIGPLLHPCRKPKQQRNPFAALPGHCLELPLPPHNVNDCHPAAAIQFQQTRASNEHRAKDQHRAAATIQTELAKQSTKGE